eukprot:7716288-Pyramimonas_sp.AAC.1
MTASSRRPQGRRQHHRGRFTIGRVGHARGGRRRLLRHAHQVTMAAWREIERAEDLRQTLKEPETADSQH